MTTQKRYAIVTINNVTHKSEYLTDFYGDPGLYTLEGAAKQINLLKNGKEPTNFRYQIIEQYGH